MQNEAQQLELLKLLEQNPNLSQRALSRSLNVSLGKANYCLKALIDGGFVKLERFSGQRGKPVFAYLLTPSGAEEKVRILKNSLRQKEIAFDALRAEIDAIRRDLIESRYANVVSGGDVAPTISSV